MELTLLLLAGASAALAAVCRARQLYLVSRLRVLDIDMHSVDVQDLPEDWDAAWRSHDRIGHIGFFALALSLGQIIAFLIVGLGD